LVKTILDSFCVKSGILCQRCEDKVRKGQVTDLDLKVIRILSELEKEYTVLEDVFFHKAVETDGTLAILVDKRDMGKVLSFGGKMIKHLGDKMGRRIKVLGRGGDARQLLEDLFSPFSILTINTIWLPDGSTETKVILNGRRPNHMPVDLDMAKKLAMELQGLSLRIEFERP